MMLVRLTGVFSMLFAVAAATLDSATAGKFGGMTFGEFLATVDYGFAAWLRLKAASSADATLVLELVLGLPAALSAVAIGVTCLWACHRRDNGASDVYSPAH